MNTNVFSPPAIFEVLFISIIFMDYSSSSGLKNTNSPLVESSFSLSLVNLVIKILFSFVSSAGFKGFLTYSNKREIY